MLAINGNKTQMIRTLLIGLLFFFGIFFGLNFGINAHAEGSKKKMNQVMKEQKKTQSHSVKSQKNIEIISNDTKGLTDEYRMTLKKIENTKLYNAQMKELLTSQIQEMETIKTQIEELKTTNKAILPLMNRMVDMIEKFVNLDKPFLIQERKKRVNDLKLMMKRADVSTSEKFRRILEAYQIENEYGRTIEAYRDSFKISDKEMTVDYLRIGRVSLVAQTLDRNQSFVWDHQNKKWTELGSDYQSSIAQGLQIARKQLAPDLIKAPIQYLKE